MIKKMIYFSNAVIGDLSNLFFNLKSKNTTQIVKKGELSVEAIITIILVLVVLFILLLYISTRGKTLENIWAKGPFG